MAGKLATKCFKDHSFAYFKQCSDAIERAYAEANLTFPSDDKELDSSQITIPQDLKGEEFQSHFIQLEFLPAADFQRLGATECEHFKQFIVDHIDEIVSQEESVESINNKINKIINKGPIDEKRLKKANIIFNNISERETIEPEIQEMAEKLATKCFNDYSFTYFKQCSDAIENEYLKADWKAAPWYRKAIHWLSSGYFRVARVSELNAADINIPQELKQSHFPQYKFLPANELLRLGVIESAHLKRFVEGQVDEHIDADDEDLDESSSLDSGTVVRLKRKTMEPMPAANSLDSGTVVIKENSLDNEDSGMNDTGTVVIKNINKSQADSDSQIKGTFVLKEDEDHSLVTEEGTPKNKSKDAIPSHPKKSDKAKYLIRALTVRSTLFLGDKPAENKPTIDEHEPPAPSM